MMLFKSLLWPHPRDSRGTLWKYPAYALQPFKIRVVKFTEVSILEQFCLEIEGGINVFGSLAVQIAQQSRLRTVLHLLLHLNVGSLLLMLKLVPPGF